MANIPTTCLLSITCENVNCRPVKRHVMLGETGSFGTFCFDASSISYADSLLVLYIVIIG